MVFEKIVHRIGGSERFQCFTQDTKLSLSKQKKTDFDYNFLTRIKTSKSYLVISRNVLKFHNL